MTSIDNVSILRNFFRRATPGETKATEQALCSGGIHRQIDSFTLVVTLPNNVLNGARKTSRLCKGRNQPSV